ncbi:MAG: sulfatase [Betaproteobacteria bacterium]
MKQPNFLFIITDQHRADHLGCYGNPTVRTPHIDAIAARGVRFDRFHVATPVCMPNRASIMTGRMPSVHRSRSNGIPLSLDSTTFSQLLLEHGYDTALIGKCHLQNIEDRPPLVDAEDTGDLKPTPGYAEATHVNLEQAAYRQELRSSWNNPEHHLTLPYYGFSHVELCNHHGDETFGDWGRWVAAQMPDFQARCGPGRGIPDPRFTAPQARRTSLPEHLYSSAYIAERSVDYLRKYAASGAQRPFFLKCSFPDPHHPFTPPGHYWDTYSPESVQVPDTCHAPGPGAPAHVRWIHEERQQGKSLLTSQRMFAVSAAETREIIALTYGMITMIDDAVGRILAALHESGLADNTVIVFTSDHGDFMGDHGLMLKGPIHYQGLVRIPFIWADPQAPQAGASSQALSSSIDIARTVLARAGIAPVNGMQGRNLIAQAAAPASAEADSILIEDDNPRAYLGFSEPVRARTLVTDKHRITMYLGANWGELYDLSADPQERHNLWDSELALRGTLLEQLVQKMMALTDRSPRPTRIA